MKLLLTSTGLFMCLKLSLGLTTLLTDSEIAANSPGRAKSDGLIAELWLLALVQTSPCLGERHGSVYLRAGLASNKA